MNLLILYSLVIQGNYKNVYSICLDFTGTRMIVRVLYMIILGCLCVIGIFSISFSSFFLLCVVDFCSLFSLLYKIREK